MATMTDDGILIRWMIRRDMTRVLDIERQCYDHPWTESEMCDYLRCRTHIGVVAVIEDEVVGYMLYGMQPDGYWIDSVTVAKGAQRCGIGWALGEYLKRKTTAQRRVLRTMVREGNLQGLMFFRSLGFTATSLEHRPYDDNDEDGYRLEFAKSNTRLILRNRLSGAGKI
jgi:ribosomal-protein-alanine N-acetyltransferase